MDISEGWLLTLSGIAVYGFSKLVIDPWADIGKTRRRVESSLTEFAHLIQNPLTVPPTDTDRENRAHLQKLLRNLAAEVYTFKAPGLQWFGRYDREKARAGLIGLSNAVVMTHQGLGVVEMKLHWENIVGVLEALRLKGGTLDEAQKALAIFVKRSPG